MYLMYIDESGDTGLVNSPTRYFALSGFIFHELRWTQYLDQIIAFRRRVKQKFGLKLREEIHASELLANPGPLMRIPKHERLAIIRMFADEIATMTDASVINILVDKTGKAPTYDVFEASWTVLLQRFENTIQHHNFPGPSNPDERGIVFPDNTDVPKLTALVRRLRRYNPVPNQTRFGAGYRNIQLQYVVEDPNFRDSRQSYFVQAADLCAFVLYQFTQPSKYVRKKSAQNYFRRLTPILCKHASSSDPDGIVRL
jgi:hypothetical protein